VESSVVFTNCTFTDNRGTHGGAVCLDGAEGAFGNCRFAHNNGLAGGGALYNYNAEADIYRTEFSANHSLGGQGGAIQNHGSRSTITDCSFEHNEAAAGGGLASALGSDATLLRCVFDSNVAYSAGGGFYSTYADLTVEDCVFKWNFGATSGGGYSVYSSIVVRDSRFEQNSSNRVGGLTLSAGEVSRCVFIENESLFGDAGAVYSTGESGQPLHIDACTFFQNSAASSGGALYLYRVPPLITNCLFNGNHCNGYGGGAVFLSYSIEPPLIRNCTFTSNIAEEGYGGGVLANSTPGVELTSCVFWRNRSAFGMSEQDQFDIPPNDLILNYCCVMNLDTTEGDGNIESLPGFVDEDGPDDVYGNADDDLRLTFGAPTVDSGFPNLMLVPGEGDLDGNARVLCGRVDMGAYELGFGDTECDGDVDLTDYAEYDACLTGPGGGWDSPACGVFDGDADIDVDLIDFAEWTRTFTGG
jgi:hypothetical protein